MKILIVISISISLLSLTIAEKVYHLNTNCKTSWYRAHHLCLINGMEFATISSKNESDQLQYQIKEAGFEDSYYIGGTNLGNNPHFYWIGDRKAMKFRNWGITNRILSTEHCIKLSGAANEVVEWFSDDCDKIHFFICQTYEEKTNGKVSKEATIDRFSEENS